VSSSVFIDANGFYRFGVDYKDPYFYLIWTTDNTADWDLYYRRGQAHSNGSLSFENDTLYSYNTPIAKIIEPKWLVLITTEKFSTTTSHHASLVGWKARRYRTCFVPSIEPNHEINIKYFLEELKSSVLKFSNASQHGFWYLQRNKNIYEDLEGYCKIFDLKMPLTLGLYLDRNYCWVKERIWATPPNREIIVPRWLAKKANSNIGLEPKDILKTRNAEIRREIVRRVGIERICYSLNAQVIDKQGDYELLKLNLQDGRYRPYLKMLNPSVPECWHIEGVHPACKTVQQALNYRRYGNDVFVSNRWWNRENNEFRSDLPNWKPETVT